MRILPSERCTVRTTFWVDPEGRNVMTVACRLEGALGSEARVGRPTTENDGDVEPIFEAELVPRKPRCDILVIGSAYSPRGVPAPKVPVSVRVGPIVKSLVVVGDRRWRFGSALSMVPAPTDPEPFTTMPITYDRAFGGYDEAAAAFEPRNPTGRGFIAAKTKESVHDKPLPNVEDPADPIRSWDSKPQPAGFGPIDPGWLPRRKFLGTYDDRYMEERHPLPPADFSLEFFNCAHPDLQVEGYLRGDEEVELKNLTPEGQVRFRLPGWRPRITVARWAADPMEWLDAHAEGRPGIGPDDVPVAEEAAEAVLDTLVLLPDDGIYYEIFRAVVPLKALDTSEIARIRVEDGSVADLPVATGRTR